jgi:cardiolipin synthase
VLAITLVAGAALLSAGHALLHKRDPRAQLSWLMTLLLLPVLGTIAYWIFGVNRIKRRAYGKKTRQLPTAPGPVSPGLAGEIREQAGPTRMADLTGLVDRIARRALVSGNRITPLHGGEDAYPAMLEAIGAAERSVTLSTYIFDGDETGRSFAEALHAARARGAEVRLLVDGIGEKYSATSIFRWLEGIHAARFNPLKLFGRAAAYLNLRNHRKILVVDGRVGFTGGMNIGDRHLAARTQNPDRVQDVHFRVTGPVVAQMQEAFAEDWYFATGEALEGPRWFPPLGPDGPAPARVITDGPDEDWEKMHWIVMGALSCARERVRIMTPYFIPDRALIGALGTTALRGVEVSLVLPAKNNLRFVQWASNAYLAELLAHEVAIYFQPPPFVHSKLFVVDDVWTFVGSTNLDPRSLRLNFELNLEAYDAQLGRALAEHFDATVARSHAVTPLEISQKPLSQRLRESAAKLFSPYL